MIFVEETFRQPAVTQRQFDQRRFGGLQEEAEGEGGRTHDRVKAQVEILQVGSLSQSGEEGEQSRFGQMAVA